MTKKLLFLIALLPSFMLGQHTIKGTFTPAESFKFAFLYRVTAETSIFANNADVNEDGTFEMTLDENADVGSYRIVYGQPQEEFNFDFIYNKEDIELAFDLEKGLSFVTSQENKLFDSYNKSKNVINNKIRAYYGSNNDNKKEFRKIFDLLDQAQKEFEKAGAGTLALEFIKAARPYIPNEYEDINTFAGHVKDNYFKNIDFSNPVLQNSNFLIQNTITYVYGFLDQSIGSNKSYMNNVDIAVKSIGNNPTIKKVILKILWDQFVADENEPVANHITNTYLLDIAKATNDTELTNKLIYFKNASIGQIGYDFEVEIKDENDKIVLKKFSDLKDSENYLLFFWSTTCSHCLDEIPQLKAYMKSISEDKLKVIAIALDNDYYRWNDMRYDYPDFIHVFGEGKWENPIGDNYNVTGTPSYFLLDNDKKIIAKPYDFKAFENQLPSILNNEVDEPTEEKEMQEDPHKGHNHAKEDIKKEAIIKSEKEIKRPKVLKDD